MKTRFPSAFRKYQFFLLLTGIVMLVLSYVALHLENARYREQTHRQVSEDVQDVARTLNEKFFILKLAAERLAASSVSPTPATEEGLAELVDDIVARFPDVISVAIAPDLVVSHVAPLEGNEAVLGLDYRTVPDQMVDVNKARLAHAPILSRPVELVQGGRGYVLRYPMFVAGPDGKETFRGIISVVFDANKVLSLPADQMRYDGPLRIGLRKQGFLPITLGDRGVFSEDAIVHGITFFGKDWDLAAVPEGGWPVLSPNFLPLVFVLLVASAAVGLTAFWMRRLTLQREHAHKLLSNAIEALDAGFVLYDENDRLTVCNSKFARIFRMTREEMGPGIRYASLMRLTAQNRQPDDRDLPDEDWLEERFARHPQGQEFILKRPDAGWVKVSERPTKDGFSVTVITDITAQKKAQLAAEEANRQKTEFLSNVTHELRTPLTVIMGFSQVLSEPAFIAPRTAMRRALDDPGAGIDAVREPARGFDAAVTQHSRTIGGSAQHMLTMVNDLLNWAEVERGAITLELETVPVSGLVASVGEELRAQAEDKGLSLVTRVEEAEVHVDPKRFKQVLYNLVGNAIKFTDEGTVTLSVRQDGGRVVFSVEDTGCGIPEKDLDRIFERFQQVDNSSTRAHGGFGLGLSIARQIAELHGGTLSVTSTPGEGSGFHCDVPGAQSTSTLAAE